MIHTVQVFGADQLAHTILFWGKTKVKTEYLMFSFFF